MHPFATYFGAHVLRGSRFSGWFELKSAALFRIWLVLFGLELAEIAEAAPLAGSTGSARLQPLPQHGASHSARKRNTTHLRSRILPQLGVGA